jgi:hypothetical protein
MAPPRTPPKKGKKKRRPGKKRTWFAATRAQWLNRCIVGAAFVVMVASITKFSHRDPIIEVLESEIDTQLSSREIRAAFDFDTIDLAPTQRAQEEAVAKVPDYYRVNEQRVASQLKALRAQIAWLKDQRPAVRALVAETLAGARPEDNAGDLVAKAVHEYAKDLMEDPEAELAFDAYALAQWLMPDKASLPQASRPPADTPAPSPSAAAADTGGAPPQADAIPAEVLPAVPAPEPVSPESLTFHTSDRLAKLAEDGLAGVLRRGIRLANLLPGDSTKLVALLRDTPAADGQTSTELPYADIMDPAAAEDYLEAEVATLAKNLAGDLEWGALSDAAVPVARTFITDTLRYDTAYTDSARERARQAVEPVMKKILASEKIQDGGSRWTSQTRTDARVYLDLLRGDTHPLAQFVSALLAHAILVALALAGLYRSIQLFRGETDPDEATLFKLALLLIGGLLAISRVSHYFEPTGFMVPVAACGILYAILANVSLAALVGMV